MHHTYATRRIKLYEICVWHLLVVQFRYILHTSKLFQQYGEKTIFKISISNYSCNKKKGGSKWHQFQDNLDFQETQQNYWNGRITIREIYFFLHFLKSSRYYCTVNSRNI